MSHRAIRRAGFSTRPEPHRTTKLLNRLLPSWVFCVLLLLLSTAVTGICEWGRAADEYMRLPFWRDTRICSDGNGGCWAAGMGRAVEPDIYGVDVCHVDRDGNFTWGNEVASVLPNQGSWWPRPVLADNGDVILAMDVADHDPDDPQKVYLQRINLDQELVWGEEGIALDTFRGAHSILGAYKGPVEDTYLIHWNRWDDINREINPLLQLIDGDGELLWGLGGIELDWHSNNSKIVISSDQCVIVAQEVEPFPSVEIVKIDADGEIIWDRSYSAASDENITKLIMTDIESDREGGIIFTNKYRWQDSLNDSLRYFGINIMRVSSDGDSLWARSLYERDSEEFRDPLPDCVFILNYAGSGRFFAAWMDTPRDLERYVKVVSLNIEGEDHWGEPIDIIVNPGSYFRLAAVDSDEGVIYVWRDGDERENGPRIQQWGQRIGIDGERLWADRGLSIQARNVSSSFLTSNGNAGVITLNDIHNIPTIQMVNRNGEIGVVLEVGVDEEIDLSEPSKLTPQLRIYPNPGNSHFRIQFDSGFPHEIYPYHIYNLMGKSIKTGTMMGSSYQINDLSRFSSGEYIFQLQSPRTTVSKRFLLIK